MAKFMIALALMAIVALAQASPRPEPIFDGLLRGPAEQASGAIVDSSSVVGAGLGSNADVGANIEAPVEAVGVGANSGFERQMKTRG